MKEAYLNSSYGNSNLSSYLEQRTMSASPLELVAMLYAKAISEIREARQQLAARNISLRSKAISKACDAIGELDGSLDMEAGGEVAQRLRSLYRYCLVRMLDANFQQADEPLGEVLGILMTLSEGWHTIAQTAADSPDHSIAQTNAQLSTRSRVPAYATSDPVPAATAGHWESGTEANDRSHSWTL